MRPLDLVYITSRLEVAYSVSLGPSEVRFPLHADNYRNKQIWYVGSGSTYVYGYCDATYKEGWGRDETVNFVKNSKFLSSFNDILFTNAISSQLSPLRCLEMVRLVV
jgi:hypothetical protein